MKVWIFFLCLSDGWMDMVSITSAAPTPSSAPMARTVDESTQLVDWLIKYGYLPPTDKSTGQLQAWTTVINAVRAMQRFAGLKDTGVVDQDTVTLMKTPRCSLPDQEPYETPSNQWRVNMKRRRRAMSSWTNRNINWRLSSYPSSSHLSREMIRSLVFYALQVWAEPTSLKFHEVATSEAADLQVDFLHGYHGDSYPFDGAGGAVGHAFFPSDPAWAGGIHLDAEEEWVFRQPVSEGTDLFTVLVHEFGHALGLTHSSSRHSVMRPYYQGPAGDPLHYSLGAEDLELITQLYGKRNQLLVTDVPHLPWKPSMQRRMQQCFFIDRCNTSFDAVARIRGETFFFKGLMMWRVTSGGLVSARGTSVRQLWRGLPPDLQRLQAVLERQSDHAIIFISDLQFWLFRGLSLQEGYPQPLSALSMGVNFTVRDNDQEEVGTTAEGWGLVWDPEEGPVWGRTKIFEGQEDNNTWTQLIREGVNGIIKEPDGSVYLFKDDTYWKFLFPGSALQDGYPRSSAADWLDCNESSSLIRVDNLSLSLSPPVGRQGFREQWREKEDKDYTPGSRRDYGNDRHRPTHKTQSSHIWTQCACQNAALCHTASVIATTTLLLWANI